MDTLTIDGVQLGPTSDYEALLRRQLKYGSVWNEVGDSGPEEGLWRAFDQAAGTEVEARLLNALLALMADADIQVRSGAVGLALDYAEKLEPEQLLSLLQQHGDLYIGIKPVGTRKGSPDLAWTLRQAIAGHSSSNPAVIQYLRDVSRDPTNGYRVLSGLAVDDSEWIVEHASEVVAGQPLRARALMAHLKTASKREAFIRALAAEPQPLRAALLTLVQEKVKAPAERDRLQNLLR